MSDTSSPDEVEKNYRYGMQYAIPLFMSVGILLLAMWLRIYPLAEMMDMLAPDEAGYGLDAVSVLHNPRLTPFFPANYGREAGWIYWLVGWFSILDISSTTMRIAAVMIGVLTVAATYRLGYELFGKSPAIWVSLSICILFWHVHFSHLAFRAITFPLMGVLAFAFLWRGFKTQRRRFWIIGGFFLGLSLYTYFSARAWIAYAGLTLCGFYLHNRRLWRHIAWAGLTAFIVCVPMFGYWITFPDLAFQRFSGVSITSIDQFFANLIEWFRMWTIEGDWFEHHNIPYRPVLDTPLIILVATGIAGFIICTRVRSQFLWMVGLLGVSSVGLLTTHANSLIRNIGSVIPLSLIIGYGAWTVVNVGKRWRMGWIVSSVLFVWAGINSLTSVTAWLDVPALYTRMERHIGQGVSYLRDHTPSYARLYFDPFPSSHPVLRFRSTSLHPRIVNGLDASLCMVIPDVSEAWYFGIIQWDADFEQRLRLWGDVQTVYIEPHHTPRYAIYNLQPRLAMLEATQPIIFGERIELRLLSVMPQTISKQSSLDMTFAMRRVGDIPDPLETYTLFVHAYDFPLSTNAVVVRAQLDVPLCETTPPYDWRADEWIVQSFSLFFPPDLPAHEYQLVIGVYVQPSFVRLPISPTSDSYRLSTVVLED